MAGIKRLHGEMDAQEKDSASNPLLSIFESFREEIDEHHDRRERVIKASKDITAYSKKMWVSDIDMVISSDR